MNIADLILAVLTVLLAYIGYRRGLIVSLLSLLKTVLGIPVSYYVSNTYSQPLYDSYVKEPLKQAIADKLTRQADVDKFLADIKESLAFAGDAIDLSSIEKLSGAKLTDYLEANVFGPLALGIIHIALFFVCFIVFGLVMSLIIRIFKHSNKKDKDSDKHESMLKKSNRLLGAVFGLLKALIIALIVATLSSYLLGSVPKQSDNTFIETLRQSKVIEYINQYNPMV